MTERPSRAIALAAAATVVLVAGALRFWRIGWGLDLGMAFTDELFTWPRYLYAFVPLRPESLLRPETPNAMVYPAFFGFLAGSAAALAHALGLMGAPQQDLFHALLLARLISAFAGTLNVLAVGFLAWRFYAPQVGLLAAALMAVVPLEAMQTHYVSTDPMLGLFVTVALILACELQRRGATWLAAAGGAAAAFAFGTKYTGLIALGAVLWASLEVALRARSVRPLLRLVPAALAAFAVALTIACPPCVLQSHLMLQAMRFHGMSSSFANVFFWNVQLVPSLGWYGRPYLYQLVAGLPFAMGWPLYLAALGAVVHAARRRTPPDRVLLVTAGAYFLTIGTAMILEAQRYYLPLFPALVVLAARALADAAARLPRGAAVAIVGGILLYTGALAFSQVARFSYDQQHAVVGWVKERFARDGAEKVRVAYPAGLDAYFGLRQPVIRAGMEPVPVPVERWLDPGADVLVVPEWLAIRIRRDWPHSDEARALDRLESGAAGWVPAARWRSDYLTSGLYTALDPIFAADLVQGEIGFTVYVRDGEARPGA